MHWKNVTILEMKTFVGITLLMGIVKKPTIRSYWQTEEMMTTPFFLQPKCLSRDRYIAILRFLRFSDPFAVDPSKKESRLSGFFSIVNDLCSQYRPLQSLSLDESLVLFKGRLSIKMFIRTISQTKLFVNTTALANRMPGTRRSA